jgi:hypothetical protein
LGAVCDILISLRGKAKPPSPKGVKGLGLDRKSPKKKFRKPLDKAHQVWYNKDVKGRYL